MSLDVSFTTTAATTASELNRQLSVEVGPEQAANILGGLIRETVSRLSSNPLGNEVCHQASVVGVIDFREIRLDRFRVIYGFNEKLEQVIVHLLLAEHQNVQRALIRHCLLKG